jgi:3-hydroxymyristoyl/3-hydroxydecanoyl-(acyl carrier protein) dehydratase
VQALVVDFELPAEHPALFGHFPGRPIVPGALLLAQALQALLAAPHWAARLGAAPRLASVKFLAPVEPVAARAMALQLHVHDTGTRLRFEVRDVAQGGRVALCGEWVAAADAAAAGPA